MISALDFFRVYSQLARRSLVRRRVIFRTSVSSACHAVALCEGGWSSASLRLVFIETRSLPSFLAATRRGFTFCVARPARSARVDSWLVLC